ncbi:hypothetical protein LGR97_17765 [Klebsiella quasipneumoniae subsp. similipneumoniae]|uniref:hypothetical protein n=1 Tax=Klebsiella quasipneumoniae TaxID=1463165 RepID=UPI001F1F987D|nr:hypothetical protein [Klebsiella quasipneumoniae]MCF2311401.1 hypothetical protein [Klebsiella quasipneumoniae subsp. similipneumoniae]HBT6279263.1 hypothetical protein [Klebsiella quasipneumoniae]HDE1083568.1 hypothetical protein [Klebsiella quasipneumoniae]HDE2007046.1 hypothetical protein [Klebsiella quasipneumoniae]HDE2017197.1 hypothetical protein [Klebsiella quasipneumoniae]
MTDITELAQREKFEAWVITQICISKSTLEGLRTSDGYRNSTLSGRDYNLMWNLWKAAGAELVEALEKAQQRIAELEEAEQKLCAANVTLDARAELAERRLAEMESRTVTAAAADVLAERQRQVTAEGWSPKHDDQYKNTELAFAASCYAFHAAAASWDLEDNGIPYDSHPVPKQWPWDPSWWRPTDARRDLVKAGALILAEIERIDRAAGIKVEAE